MSKLSKKQKRRVEGYLDMLEFNHDCISFMGEDDRLYRIEIVNQIIETNTIKPIDKKHLTLLEKLYHKFSWRVLIKNEKDYE